MTKPELKNAAIDHLRQVDRHLCEVDRHFERMRLLRRIEWLLIATAVLLAISSILQIVAIVLILRPTQ